MAKNNRELMKSLGFLSSVGISIVLSTLIGLAIGVYLDKWLDTSPWLTLIFLGVGIASGFRNIFILTARELRRQDQGVVKTVTIENDPLLQEITRRNWSILVLLTVISLFWWSLEISLAVLAGGLLAILGHHLRERSLRKMLTQPHAGSAKGFQFGYVVRLAILGSGIYLLIVKAQLPPLAVVSGLSVVIVNIFWTAFRRCS